MKGDKILLADFGFLGEADTCYQDPAINQESADLWSLVVTSFELACFRLPFTKGTLFTEEEKERLSA